jgi:hypothetical protein
MSNFAETIILLANPASSAADVTITCLRESGGPVVETYTVPPTSRFNVDVEASCRNCRTSRSARRSR